MSVAFGTSNTALTASNGSTLAVTKPTSTASGDYLLFALETVPTTNGGPTITGPTGFTAFASSPFVGGTGSALYVWWKLAGGSEPSTYSVGFSFTGSVAAALVARYTGTNQSTPNGNSSGTGGGSITTLAVAAPTGIGTGGVSVMVGGSRPDSSTSTDTITMPGTSRVSSVYTGSGFGAALALSDSTATASGNVTDSVSSEMSEFTVVLKAVTTANADAARSATGTRTAAAATTKPVSASRTATATRAAALGAASRPVAGTVSATATRTAAASLVKPVTATRTATAARTAAAVDILAGAPATAALNATASTAATATAVKPVAAASFTATFAGAAFFAHVAPVNGPRVVAVRAENRTLRIQEDAHA